jgi:hypothetical protein
MSSFSIWLRAFRYCAGKINRMLVDLVEILRFTTKPRAALDFGSLEQ